MEIFRCLYDSPVGLLRLEADSRALLSVSFTSGQNSDGQQSLSPLLATVKQQLTEYFEGARLSFDLPLAPSGSDFQQQVWKLVCRVPFGETKSYGELAQQLGSVGFSRAVGVANGQNPIPIIIPCHRIIGANGLLTGYSGGLERKKWLLVHEQQIARKALF